jgi:hypothetical protein
MMVRVAERTQDGPAWPVYGGAAVPQDPLQRTLDADLTARTPPAGPGARAPDGRSAGTSSGTTTHGPAGAPDAGARPPSARGSRRDRGFWSSLRRGLVPGAGAVLTVLVLGRAASGLGPESVAVVAPYSTILVVGPVLGVGCAVGWVVHAARRRAARARGDMTPVRPSRVLGAATTVLGVLLAALVVTPLWVGVSA